MYRCLGELADSLMTAMLTGVTRGIFGACLALLLFACSGTSVAPVEKRDTRIPSVQKKHTVHEGDSLYMISWLYDMDYREIARWNRIKPPYRIFPGQEVRLSPPEKSSTTSSEPLKVTTVSQIKASKTTKPVAKPPTVKKKTVKKKTVKSTAQSSRYKDSANNKIAAWKWPVQGKILRRFSAKGNKGIDIGGKLGQSVYATAGGNVVYSGSGLIGYGKLIIIKHNKNHLSAYAHNSQLLVKEGDRVEGGQRIAKMGRAGGKETMLHFEIRKNGKPVNPLRYLPKT